MLINLGMFSGSFPGNKLLLEHMLKASCSEIPVARLVLCDGKDHGRSLTVSVEEGRYVSATFFAVLARGRPKFYLTEEDVALTKAFFSEHWKNASEHPTLQFVKEVGAGVMVEVTWKYEEMFASTGPFDERERTQMIHGGIRLLELGILRAATQNLEGTWSAHPWVKRLILAYFGLSKIEYSSAGPMEFADKIPIQKPPSGVRVVPPGVIRRGACVRPGVTVMPGYVNIGSYVDSDSMVDTWATVGSCAQIGRGVHLSGGVGIGGVLDPIGAMPVVIEDGAFIGSRSLVVEGVIVEREAVIAAGVAITASTPIIDMREAEPKIFKGRVPSRAIVVSGTQAKSFRAGSAHITCAYIIGTRSEATNLKLSLEAALRDVRETGACI